MDAETDPLLRAVVGWASGRPDVRAVVLTGSRSAEEGTGDAVSDFDVDLLVEDPHAFGDDDWLEEIAPVLVASEDEDGGDPVRLVFFSAQRKVEFRLRAASAVALGDLAGDVLFPDGTGPGATVSQDDAAGSGTDGGRSIAAEDDDGWAATDDREEWAGADDAPAEPTLLALLPVLTAPDVPAWLAHYRALGFDVHPDDDGSGVAVRDGLALRVVPDPAGTPAARGIVVVVVDDAGALARGWSAVPGGRTTSSDEGGRTRWTHVDPAGNVLRIGSPG
ncbi:aminoglycoside 6-adenylyltransferase [Patulibacter minatonensis]|uniref:aminoglycoside 6-adenylyltransferase n=1 Tax=Patulibacter minatonensis TaxID=298163 RepID=UPI00047CEB26|nr:aminoglycoside 6-adenylyltransferase [Patulibacter minatonensis]